MKRVSIAGAGLVGSLLAVLLRKRGYAVEVYERRSDPRASQDERGRSINLVITSRGLHALKTAGLVEKALALSVPVYGRMVHGLTGDPFFQPYGQEGECNYSVSRIELNKFLITAAEEAGAKVHFEHVVDSLDLNNKTATFSAPGGKVTASYEVLFGADGAGSRVRHELCRLLPQLFQERTDWLEADYKEIFFPLGKDGKPLLKTDALHIWPRGRHMLMALSNLDGSFTGTLYMPKTGSPSFASIQTEEDARALLAEQMPDALALVPDAPKDLIHNPQGSLGTVRLNHWVYEDSVALIGDAAHAIVPFFGQGMNSGFEDCTGLMEILDAGTADWRTILSRYEEQRRPNASAIADMALENWHEMKEKVADPKFQLRKKLESMVEQKHPGFYKSRYGLITYTLTPYRLAQSAGELQSRFFEGLCSGINSVDETPWDKVENFLKTDWQSFLQRYQPNLEHYVP